MSYIGSIYRPPSEAYSLIVQVTVGCAHNSCTFCSMFKDKEFHIKSLEEILIDLLSLRKVYPHVKRIFLADGDALVLKNTKLVQILEEIKNIFPECERVGVYGSPQDVNRKTDEELEELYRHGVKIIYIGGESGNDKVLADIKKGVSSRELVEAVQKIERSGISASITFINGLAGAKREASHAHAVDTGKLISLAKPSYVGLLTLMVEPAAPLYEAVTTGEFSLLEPLDVVRETLVMLQNIDVDKECIFRSNHASNYFSLKGTLPQDREVMINQLKEILNSAADNDEYLLKDERFRAL